MANEQMRSVGLSGNWPLHQACQQGGDIEIHKLLGAVENDNINAPDNVRMRACVRSPKLGRIGCDVDWGTDRIHAIDACCQQEQSGCDQSTERRRGICEGDVCQGREGFLEFTRNLCSNLLPYADAFFFL
jgi:hypothetical protein